MTKRYSQKWQRYFVKLLDGVPFFNETCDYTTKNTRVDRVVLSYFAAVSVAAEMPYLYRI